jgi:hypothetical protein
MKQILDSNSATAFVDRRLNRKAGGSDDDNNNDHYTTTKTKTLSSSPSSLHTHCKK